MSKPDDIPQDVWDAAERPALRIAVDYAAGQIWDVRPTIARAIMAATAFAYTEIAEMADAFADAADFSAMNTERPEIVARYRTEEATLNGFAAAIRARDVKP